jgi:hypothetical protein
LVEREVHGEVVRFRAILEGKKMNVAPPRTLRMASVMKRVRSGEVGAGDAM